MENIKIKFKTEIEILIRLFYYYRYLNDKMNSNFVNLSQEASMSAYLINNKWLENFKSFYEYQELEKILQLQLYDKSFTSDYYLLTEKYIDTLIANIPESYINLLKSKDKFKINEIINKYEKTSIKGTNERKNIDISFFINIQLINSSIYSLLMKGGYLQTNQLKNCDIYSISNNKILLNFKRDIIKINDEIGYINNKNVFIPEYILYYTNDNIILSQLNYFLTKDFLSFIFDVKEESCRIYKEHNKKIGNCFRIKNAPINDEIHSSNDLNENAFPLDKKEKDIKNCIELLIQFYLFHERMKNIINQSLIHSNIEKFYIINDKWINEFLVFFEFNQFEQSIRGNNINEIINKNNSNGNNPKIISQIKNLLSNEFIQKIKSKNIEAEINQLKNRDYYSLKIKSRILMGGTPTQYYSDIGIINDDIYILAKDIFKLNLEENKEFLIGDNKIIMSFCKTSQYSLIIGNYFKLNFIPDIILDLNSNKYLNNYIEKFKTAGYFEIMKNIDLSNDAIFLFQEDNFENKIGYAYQMKSLEDNNKNNSNKNNSSPYNTEKNKNNLTFTDKKKENSDVQNNKENSKIFINIFIQNQAKALILYYYFTQSFIMDISLSNGQLSKPSYKNGECYLIDETWTKLHKEYFSYEKIIQQIEKIQQNFSFRKVKLNKEQIFENFDIEFKKELQFKGNEKPEEKFGQIIKGNDIFIKSNKDENIFEYPCKYEIIDSEIFELMNRSPENILRYSSPRKYIINDGNIIIKFESDSPRRYELLFGNYNTVKYHLTPKFLIKYNTNKIMNNHFEHLKQFSYKIFKSQYTSTNGKNIMKKINGQTNNEIAGEIFIFIHLNSKGENQTEKEKNKGQEILNNKKKETISYNNGIYQTNNVSRKDKSNITSGGIKKPNTYIDNYLDNNVEQSEIGEFNNTQITPNITIPHFQNNLSNQLFNPNPNNDNKNIIAVNDFRNKEIIKKKNEEKNATRLNIEEIMKNKKEICNLIYIMIDLQKIYKKIASALNDKTESIKYYILNRKLFNIHLENKILNYIFNDNIINNRINSAVNKNIDYTNNLIFNNLKLDKDFIKEINNINTLFRNDILHIHIDNESIFPQTFNNKQFYYYNDFILLTEDSIKNIFWDISKIPKIICLFGDNLAFLINDKIVGLYDIKGNEYFPKMFFVFYDIKYVKESIKLLKEIGFEKYKQNHLLFNNNIYATPIFNLNKCEVGNAYLYNSTIQDYSGYIINKTLMVFIKLYFNYARINSNNKKLQDGKYLLLNPELINQYKTYFNYSSLEKKLNENKYVQNIVLKMFQNNYDIIHLLNDKDICSIIYQFWDINQEFSKKNNLINNKIGKEPKIEQIEGNSYYYYKNLELIDEDIYKILFPNEDYINNGNYRDIYFQNNYIYFTIPGYLCNNKIPGNIEICLLNQNNTFEEQFLIECSTTDSFKIFLQNVNLNGGFGIYLNRFQNNNIEQLYDNNGRPIGIIYNLKANKQTPIPPIPPIPPVPFKSIKEEFKKPPLIGLKNVGATCYMNATLQCLSQIEKIADYFKYHKTVDIIINNLKGKECLTKSFKILIENLWPSRGNKYLKKEYIGKNSNNYHFSPVEFKEKISSMNPLFQGVQANDAKDLVNFIVMTLHEELNKKKKDQKLNNLANLNYDQTNQQIVLNNFLIDFINNNQSIISDILYGVSHTLTKCSRCQIIRHNFEAYFFLNFPLEEVRKYKLQYLTNQNMMISNQNNMNMNPNFVNVFQQNLQKINLLQNNQINIFDCFEYNQKEESFFGDNSLYCNNCQAQLPGVFSTNLYSTPEILIIVLNRGQGIQFKVKLEFYNELNLTNFIQARINNDNIMYDLIGVVTHMGESGASGHFIATCRSPINGAWYQYNDDLAYQIHDFNKEILNYAMPYILFYQKRN